MANIGSLIGKRLGGLFDSNEKQLKKLQPLVQRINGLESDFHRRTDEELRATTETLRDRLADGSKPDDLIPEAFAAVREASRRTTGLRHFDVQLMGGIVLHQGRIAEMKTGEGKTLVATLPLYLNALPQQGAHLVTVNDYLAKRDCLWMGPIYHALGLSVACITGVQEDLTIQPSFLYDPEYEDPAGRWSKLRPVSRHDAYRADITYGTNNEFGFDYLRDNMVPDLGQCVQRSLSYAIVDEVDNILIDEARTPLIISGPSDEAARLYEVLDRVVAALAGERDFTIDERTRTVHLTDDSGIPRVEAMLRDQGLLKGPNLYDDSNAFLTFFLQSALRAHALFRRDKDYVVKNGQVIIVDEHTGRLMPGRRYSEGLHQALEAKEHVPVQRESITHATVTFQNFFRMYGKLAGMTGTAATEAEEFSRIYKLEVVEIPTHRPMIRADYPDRVYRDEASKFKAVAREVKALHESGRPVLVGTTSIETSEVISDLFVRSGIRPQVLNAKNHEREASIVAEAGRLGAVTVATNMAGRGVDIILGGTPGGRDADEWQSEHDRVIELGGLAVVGTEHHEARRIDNQLRGRAGRQGDPGSTLFFVSLDDEIMRRFGGDRVKSLMQWAGMDEDTPIEHPMVTKALGNAQVQTEGYHFDIRKHLVEFDDVLNNHREAIYAERRKVLASSDLRDDILAMFTAEARQLIANHVDSDLMETDQEGLRQDLQRLVAFTDEQSRMLFEELPPGDPQEEMMNRVIALGSALYEEREREFASMLIDDGGDEAGLFIVRDELRHIVRRHTRSDVAAPSTSMMKRAAPSRSNEQDRTESDVDAALEPQCEECLQQNSTASRVRPDAPELTGNAHGSEEGLQPVSVPIVAGIDCDGLLEDISSIIPLTSQQLRDLFRSLPEADWFDVLASRVSALAEQAYKYLKRESRLGQIIMRSVGRRIVLSTIDRAWMEHLTAMEYMRQGIGLRAVAQQQPLVVYKKEGHALFQGMLEGIRHDVPAALFRVSLRAQQPVRRPVPAPRPMPLATSADAGKKIGRNDPCPCGSGKKYKRCCGK